MLARERDLATLLEKILRAAQTLTLADGGSLYRYDPDKRQLAFATVLNDSLGFWYGGTSGQPVPFSPLPLFDDAGRALTSSVVTHCAHQLETVAIPDAYAAEGFDFTGAKAFDRQHHYRSVSFLTVPLLDHNRALLGVLQLVNARNKQGEIIPFAEADVAFIEALTAQAAIVLDNHLMVVQLEELFSKFANLIAAAIDEKSKHTSAHCQRVPALTMLLADAAHAQKSGPLGSFTMSDSDRRELLLAANLHDCGKITTPEYVLDKATKLTGMHDRIEAIELRLEVVKRDCQIEAAQRRLAGADPEVTAQWLEAQLAILEADQRFLRKTNFGVERMAADDMQRVKLLAQRLWRNPRGQHVPLLSAEEVDALCIPYGTLSQTERMQINNHIVATIKMLEALPWPPQLRNVPEFAGGHHERMDGRGYPKGLRREDMSWQARMMALADIFEALTAKDRPYKRPNTLSEAMQILAKMVANQHVDPDLFRLFVTEKVYLAYAEHYLDPAQIDSVEIEHILALAGLSPA
ncbi:GAF domain-containing protein [Parvibium lacunae]|uniref:GAF domain-containing protein n=2 Tax=Parvibium lacunae TaxID=1888893 RepID=A0A368L8G3_9BURK|nr:HD family phosphohydrolase [Parvibium lacunae]RCS59894.1 GAF domain-containing protein [Parvibium lacunae]